MKKRLLIEQDIYQLDDFRTILLLNKKKLDYNDVEFQTEDGRSFSDTIEMTPHGLLFHFDDLEQFLKFFFQETYQEGDGEWEAGYYDRMYYGNWDFYDDCQNRAYDDWTEGYTLQYFCQPAMSKLKQLALILDPSMSENFIQIQLNGRISYEGGGDLPILLDKFFPELSDKIDEIVCTGKDRAVSKGAQEMIEEKFCDGLKQFGIENWGKSNFTNCFKTYFISWGNLVQFFINEGEFDGNVLDIMFRSIERGFNNHPPEYYEIEHYVWDEEIFLQETCGDLEDLMDEYIEKAQEDIHPKYVEVMRKLNRLQLFTPTQLPDKKYYIKVESVDPETIKVNFRVGTNRSLYNGEYGSSDVDSVIAMATQPGLFDPTEFRIRPPQLRR